MKCLNLSVTVDTVTAVIVLANEQGRIVDDYIKTIKSPIISDYFDRMYAMFRASIK